MLEHQDDLPALNHVISRGPVRLAEPNLFMTGNPIDRQPMTSSSGTGAWDRPGPLIALFVIGFAAFVNLYVTQPLLPQFRHLFNASELLVSLTVSGPVLAVAFTASVIGLVADAMGRKRVIVAGMLGLALPTALAGTAANLGQLVAWRFLQGIFIAAIASVAIAYINEEAPLKSVGAIMSTYVTGGVVGGFAGRFLTGLISAGYGWRAPFLVLGAITFAGALAIWRLLPRSTKFVPERNVRHALKPMAAHLRNPQLLATYAAGFNVLFCLVGAFTYVNFYLADKPFFLGPAALASIFVVYLIGAVVTPAAGAHHGPYRTAQGPDGGRGDVRRGHGADTGSLFAGRHHRARP